MAPRVMTMLTLGLLVQGCFTEFDVCRRPGRCSTVDSGEVRDAGADGEEDARDAAVDVPCGEEDRTPCVEGGLAGTCLNSACCTGCFIGSTCVDLAETSPGACGSGGDACGPCGGSTPSCIDGACGVLVPVRLAEAGGQSTCVLSQSNNLYCFGATRDNQNPASAICPECEEVACSLNDAGYCCGVDTSDELRVLASDSLVGEFRGEHLSLGLRGIATACMLDLDGNRLCWGRDQGMVSTMGERQRVLCQPTDDGDGRTYTAISVGMDGTCAISDEQLFCWGRNNDSGELGGTGVLAVPTLVSDLRVSQVAHQNNHTCVLTPTGQAHCMGLNEDGQIGNPACSGSCSPPIEVIDGAGFLQIDAGDRFTCAIRQGTPNTLHCWGFGENGRLGTGDELVRTVPSEPIGDANWLVLSVGLEHACALDDQGQAFCWGDNGNNRTGTGSATFVATPTAVVTDQRFVGISAGVAHTCAWTDEGALYCWGSDEFSQGPTASTVPVLVELSPAPSR